MGTGCCAGHSRCRLACPAIGVCAGTSEDPALSIYCWLVRGLATDVLSLLVVGTAHDTRWDHQRNIWVLCANADAGSGSVSRFFLFAFSRSPLSSSLPQDNLSYTGSLRRWCQDRHCAPGGCRPPQARAHTSTCSARK